MATKRHPTHLWIPFAILLAAIALINVALFVSQPQATGYVAANATISLCVNSPPVLNISDCQAIAFAGTAYSCTVEVNDSAQLIFDYTIVKLTGPSAGDNLFSMSGPNLTFTANNSQVGNYTLRFIIDDRSGCGLTNDSEDLNLTINYSSNAPYLVTPLPNRTWAANTLLLAFDLDSYFADPNGDVLTYTAIGNSNIGVSITNGEVLLTPASNWCGTESFTFRATDPTNLTADSNTVTFTVTCPSTTSTSATTKRSSGGGGGGGGGSAATVDQNRCIEQYSCFEWSSCQLTRAVSLVDGSSRMVEVTGVRGVKKYVLPEEETVDANTLYQGFSYRDCIDTRVCSNTRTITYIKACTYKPSCDDGVQNQGETAIDCGGPCAPCGTCQDGIQNQDEEDVDCGGLVCAACGTCSDGQMNGRELGVDCGGDCEACATCIDGVQNQDEEGVDCGGTWCDACLEQQFPTLRGALPWLTILLVVLIGLVVLFIFFAAIKRRFASLFLAYLFRHKKKNRTILVPTDVKSEILARLSALEAVADKQPMLKNQEELARIIRDYFRYSLHLEFEFTYEELVQQVGRSKLNPVLASIMQHFFRRISLLEFSGVAITPIVLRALIQETRELVCQTAVLTIDDLKERERDLQLRDIPADTPALDRAYLLLSQIHLCLQFHKLELAGAIYQVLLEWYNKAPVAEQSAIFEDFNRVYEEHQLARGKRSL